MRPRMRLTDRRKRDLALELPLVLKETVSGLSAEDAGKLERLLQRGLHGGFRAVVIAVRTGRTERALVDWLRSRPALSAVSWLEADLGRLAGQNLWAELTELWRDALASARAARVAVLRGVSETREAGGAHSVFQQLNVQRDSLVRDFDWPWIVLIHPSSVRQLRKEAPDFSDYVALWLEVEEPDENPRIRHLEALQPSRIDERRVIGERERSAEGSDQKVAGLLEQASSAYSRADYTVAKDLLAQIQLEPSLSAEERIGAGQLLAAIERVTGNPSRALARLQDLLASLLPEQARLRADLLGEIARIYFEQGQPQKALELHEQEKRMYEALGDERSLAITLGDIARIYRNQGQPQKALELHEQRREMYEALGDQRSLAITLGDIARIYSEQGQPQKALELHQQEKRTYEALGDQRSLAITLGDIARIYSDQGQPQKALELHERQREMFEALGDPRSLAITLGDIARIYSNQGQPQKALELHERQREMLEALGDRRPLAITLGDIARIYSNQGQPQKALGLHEQQREMLEALGDQRSLAITLGDIARIYAQEGRLEEAKALQLKRLATNQELGDPDGVAAASWDLAQLALAEQNGGEALRLAEESFATFLMLGRADGIAIVGADLGKWLCAAEQWVRAVQVLEPALAMAERLGVRNVVERIENALELARKGLAEAGSAAQAPSQ